ncbi:MAG: GNAT family N-acetyltransferase [Promethearchaeota archaeon]
MEIEYRTYNSGDEKGLAELFNISFHGSGFGFLRTPNEILWRYVNRPGSSFEEIRIALDKQSGKIIGSVFCVIEEIYFNGKSYKIGSINDVAVLPKYRKFGIANELMKQALKFMNSQKCNLSSLVADPKGHARKKLYIPLGWQDFETFQVFLKPNLLLVKFLPIIFPFTSVLLFHEMYNYFKLQRIKKKLTKLKYDVKIIHSNENPSLSLKYSSKLRKIFNTASKQQFNGFNHITKELWHHFREKPIREGMIPTYILIFKNKRLIGFVSFLRQWIYFEKYGFRIPLAIVREMIIDHSNISNIQNLRYLYNFLILSMLKAAKDRKCAVTLFTIASKNRYSNTILKNLHFNKINGGVFMINSLDITKIEKLLAGSNKPIKPDIGEMFLYP